MGTNYFAISKQPRVHDRMVHLGKASGGWRFLFHETDDIKTYPQFVQWLEKNITEKGEYVLMNEYEEEVAVEELLELIQSMQGEDNPRNFSNARDVDGYRFSIHQVFM